MSSYTNGSITPNDRKSKKKKQASSTSIRVKVIESNPHDAPIVCSFPGGVPTTASLSQPHQNPVATFQWFKKKIKQNSQRSLQLPVDYVLKGQDAACQYYGTCTTTGTNTGSNSSSSGCASSSSSSSSSSRTKLCVGVYDKHTNVVTVYPTAGNGSVITLQQYVPSYHRRKNETSDDATSGSANNNINTTALLYADFGSAKKRRVLQSEEANRVTVDAVVGDTTTTSHSNTATTTSTTTSAFHNPSMSESNRSAIQYQQQMNLAIETTTSSSLQPPPPQNSGSIHIAAEMATNSWRQTFLPPFDMSATDPNQIYTASTIAGPAVWDSILRLLVSSSSTSSSFATDTTTNSITASSIMQYLNTARGGGQDVGSTTLPTNQKHYSDDIVYCSDIVRELLSLQGTARSSSSSGSNESSTTTFFKSAMVLNYFICLYLKFQQQKFRMPALLHTDDENDMDDHDDTEINDRNSSFRFKLYGSTPLVVLHRFLDLFTSQVSTGGRSSFDGKSGSHHNMKCCMSRAQQDKCLVHIFVLYIMMNGSNSRPNVNERTNQTSTTPASASIVVHDIMPFLNELQLSDQINHGVLLLREAGCIVTRVAKSSSTTKEKRIKVELSVPLTFPKPKKKQRS